MARHLYLFKKRYSSPVSYSYPGTIFPLYACTAWLYDISLCQCSWISSEGSTFTDFNVQPLCCIRTGLNPPLACFIPLYGYPSLAPHDLCGFLNVVRSWNCTDFSLYYIPPSHISLVRTMLSFHRTVVWNSIPSRHTKISLLLLPYGFPRPTYGFLCAEWLRTCSWAIGEFICLLPTVLFSLTTRRISSSSLYCYVYGCSLLLIPPASCGFFVRFCTSNFLFYLVRHSLYVTCMHFHLTVLCSPATVRFFFSFICTVLITWPYDEFSK